MAAGEGDGTGEVARAVYELDFDGIGYLSRYGRDIRNWALFEPFLLTAAESARVGESDPDFVEAMAIHSLRLG